MSVTYSTNVSRRHDDPTDSGLIAVRGKVAILTVGVSASGKTTWADKAAEYATIVCRDTIREDILGNRGLPFSWAEWQKAYRSNEKMCSKIQMDTIDELIKKGNPIIVADTNISTSTVAKLRSKFTAADYDMVFKHFDVPYEEAIQRDNARVNGVGVSVIAKQFDSLANLYDTIPRALTGNYIICDIDGTLAHATHRDIYDDGAAVLSDTPDTAVLAILNAMISRGTRVYIVSGRRSENRANTMEWLETIGMNDYMELYMRGEGDRRPDTAVKHDILYYRIMPREDFKHPLFVIDDRPRLCRFWRSEGIKTFQVGNPAIEF